MAGKYKVPFQKLKKQLADELSEYLKAYSLEDLRVATDNSVGFKEFADTVNQIFKEGDIGCRVGKAAFQEFDLEQVKQLAEELKNRIYNEAYVPYFHKHTCLYTTQECFSEVNPLIPRIYNSLVDKFFDEETGTWKEDETAKESAILIYIQEGVA